MRPLHPRRPLHQCLSWKSKGCQRAKMMSFPLLLTPLRCWFSSQMTQHLKMQGIKINGSTGREGEKKTLMIFSASPGGHERLVVLKFNSEVLEGIWIHFCLLWYWIKWQNRHFLLCFIYLFIYFVLGSAFCEKAQCAVSMEYKWDLALACSKTISCGLSGAGGNGDDWCFAPPTGSPSCSLHAVWTLGTESVGRLWREKMASSNGCQATDG